MKSFKLALPFFSLALFVSLFQLTACNNEPKDADIEKNITDTLAANNFANVTATVKDGDVVLTGSCEGENCKSQIEEKVKSVEGVEEVENNITESMDQTDFTLRTSVQTIISKYEGVQADVANGEVTLRGSINRDQLQPLMAELNTLQPKKVDNQLAVK